MKSKSDLPGANLLHPFFASPNSETFIDLVSLVSFGYAMSN